MLGPNLTFVLSAGKTPVLMAMNEIVFDIETDGLLDKVSKIHCLCWEDENGTEGRLHRTSDIIQLFNDLPDAVYIGHTVICYDFVVLKRLLGIEQPRNVVDTLPLAWYLHPSRNSYGLESYGEDYGVPKPVIDDWENLTTEDYIHRCSEDVKINWRLWSNLKSKLGELYDE